MAEQGPGMVTHPLPAGERIIVVATRAGLSRLLADSTTGSDTAPQAPYRLLAPWSPPDDPLSPLAEVPHPRPGSAGPETGRAEPWVGSDITEGPRSEPPIRPADGGSTRPA